MSKKEQEELEKKEDTQKSSDKYEEEPKPDKMQEENETEETSVPQQGKIDTSVDEDMAVSSKVRNLSGWARYVFGAIAIVGALFHLYILNFNPIDPWIFRSIHLTFGLVLGFMLFSGWRSKSNKVHIVDWILIVLAVLVGVYIYVNLDQILFRFGVTPTTMDFIVALIGLLLVTEFTRRTSGWTLPILSFIFIGYVFLGPYLPGILNHNGYSLERFVTYIYGLDGVFGVTTDVSSKYIILFIIFGAFLQKSGVGQYFMNLAFSVAGSMRGGPAKVAVISSALMGTINGTSAGNVVATGSLTIPLMKKTGYPPQFAGATEATASAGGQLLPPIMGAGAFLMAEITGIPYSEIIIAAAIPALLYFISVYFMVDIQAIKSNLKGIPRNMLPDRKNMLKQAYLFIPILILIALLVSGRSIIMSGTVAIVATFIISLFNKETRMKVKDVLTALEAGMKDALQLIAIVACAGIIVGVIALTGIGQRFSSMLLSLADNNILLALIFAMVISIILGLGMPTTAAYAVAASTIAPGLIGIGLEPLVAHLFVFYFAVISAITPPVALAAFAAAGIAGTDPMKTSVTAFRLGLAAFIIPFMFFFSPQLLMEEGSTLEIAYASVTAIIGIYILAAGIQGYFFKKATSWYSRVLLFGAALLLMLSGLVTDLAGAALVVLVILIQKFINKTPDPDSVKTQQMAG